MTGVFKSNIHWGSSAFFSLTAKDATMSSETPCANMSSSRIFADPVEMAARRGDTVFIESPCQQLGKISPAKEARLLAGLPVLQLVAFMAASSTGHVRVPGICT